MRKMPNKRGRFLRRGTIMIMVVALLVLLALMGTAWIASVSTDRNTSRSNTHNTQADLNIEAVGEMVKARVGVSDLMGINSAGVPVFRPRSDATGYLPWTCPVPDIYDNIENATQSLASRIPAASQRLNPQNGSYSLYRDAQGNLDVFWPGISAPLVLASPGLTSPINIWGAGAGASSVPFESPWRDPQLSTNAQYLSNQPQVVRYNQRTQVRPRFISLTVNGVSTSYPAFILSDGTTRVLAADADGDGIADAGLWPLPGGTIDGITWYAAVRIIDNNSAVNVNTAWQWANMPPLNTQWPASGTSASLFPSNIDLAGLLKNPLNDITNLNRLRFGGTTTTYGNIVTDAGTDLNGVSYLSGGYDALWNQLGRRVENPGYDYPVQNGSGVKFAALPISDQLSLAYRFLYNSPDAYGQLERRFTSTVNGQTLATLDGPAISLSGIDTDVSRWFDKYFNYDQAWDAVLNSQANVDPSIDYSRRAIMVTRNPVSMQIDPGGWISSNPFAIVPPTTFGVNYSPVPSKVSLNTGTFSELWLAYWNVMAEHMPTAAQSPLDWNTWDTTPFWRQLNKGIPSPYVGMDFNDKTQDPIPALNVARQFRSIIRDYNAQPQVTMDPSQVLLLRSAIAAANTIRLRTGTLDAPAPMAPLRLDVKMNGVLTPVDVSIYPAQPQPVISEVYVNTDDTPRPAPLTGVNANGYIAVELYNPTETDIDLTGWKVGYITRTGSGSSSDYKATLTAIADIKTDKVTVIPRGGYIVIDNKGNATYRPAPATNLDSADPGALEKMLVELGRLSECIGKELVILRPVSGSTNGSSYVPVDQFDLNGLKLASQNIDQRANADADHKDKRVAMAWHYVRKTDTAQPFRFVYPGRYVGNRQAPVNDPIPQPHQQGTQYVEWYPERISEADGTENWGQVTGATPFSLGQPNTASSYPKSTFTIQLFDKAGGDTGKYPFGGFARVGDVMQVPFIGAYTIQLVRPDGSSPPANEFIEINSLPMDAAFAEDTDTSDDAMENIGRFCPALIPRGGELDVSDDWSNNDSATWRYRWAMKIFDYFTVFAPYDDYLANAPRERLGGASRPVANSDPDPAVANTVDERLLGVDGLININTAPWRVLATLPMVPNNPTDNARLAKAIVVYRDGDGTNNPAHGAFKSLFDLYKVDAIRKYVNDQLSTSVGAEMGNISGSQITGDFLNQYLFLTRISNLVTTRSDTFTCYLLVQGWKNVGTNNPQLVAERRSAFVLDRTGVTPDCAARGVNPQKAGLKVTVFPNE